MVKYTSSNFKKKKIFNQVKNYFKDIDPKTTKPSKWKVPIGGGYYNSKEVNSVINCYLKGHLSTQIPVNEFENRFSKYIGLKYAVATNSGTSANILALNTLIENGDLKKGDKIAIPATTFISVATPIIQLGLIPLYIDIKKDLNMDMDELSIALKKYN
jgi:dTDP-4-amino-4,6-dideoxygalactose transaminase